MYICSLIITFSFLTETPTVVLIELSIHGVTASLVDSAGTAALYVLHVVKPHLFHCLVLAVQSYNLYIYVCIYVCESLI